MIVVGPIGLLVIVALIVLVAAGRLTVWDAILASLVILFLVWLLR